MPFDEEDKPSVQSQKIGIKKVSSQKSIFETMSKNPTQEDLDKKVQQVQERDSSYKARASDLALQFNKAMLDKTLPQNKNVLK